MKRYRNALVFGLALILFALATSGCVGAPKGVADLDKMPQAEFEDWRDRTAAVAEEAAFAVVADDPNRLDDVETLSASLRALCVGTVTADAVKLLGMDPRYAGLIKVATLELAAVIRQRIGPASHPRLQDLVCAFASALETGAIRGLDSASAGAQK